MDYGLKTRQIANCPWLRRGVLHSKANITLLCRLNERRDRTGGDGRTILGVGLNFDLKMNCVVYHLWGDSEYIHRGGKRDTHYSTTDTILKVCIVQYGNLFSLLMFMICFSTAPWPRSLYSSATIPMTEPLWTGGKNKQHHPAFQCAAWAAESILRCTCCFGEGTWGPTEPGLWVFSVSLEVILCFIGQRRPWSWHCADLRQLESDPQQECIYRTQVNFLAKQKLDDLFKPCIHEWYCVTLCNMQFWL